MNLEPYYRRLGIEEPAPDLQGLAALQAAQMNAVTFEDIDPLLGKVPDVSPAGVFEKLLVAGRGGYCFELNTLFGAALSAAGFDAQRVMARVRNGAPEGAQRSHLAWIVAIDGEEWLADTGFGGPGASVPLRLAARDAQDAPTGRYRFVEDASAGELVLERETGDGWFSLFGFDRVPVRDADIEAANFVTARWERAPFSSNLMLSRHGENGRISLLNTALRVETGSGVSRRTLASARDLQSVLADEFALPACTEMAQAIWHRLDALGHLAEASGKGE